MLEDINGSKAESPGSHLVIKVVSKQGECIITVLCWCSPPCVARWLKSEWEELAWGIMSSGGPKRKRGTPATWGELRWRDASLNEVFNDVSLLPIKEWKAVVTHWMASAKPSVRCGTTRVGVLGTILSSSSKKCCCKNQNTDGQKLRNPKGTECLHWYKVHSPCFRFQAWAGVHDSLRAVCSVLAASVEKNSRVIKMI